MSGSVRGLWTILAFFDREPALARVCVVQAMRGGPQVLERREEILAGLAAVVDEGREEGSRGMECTPLTAEGLVGAAFGIVYARLLRGEREPLAGLLGELMAMIVLPYLGPAAARREHARPAPALPDCPDVSPRRPGWPPPPLHGVPDAFDISHRASAGERRELSPGRAATAWSLSTPG